MALRDQFQNKNPLLVTQPKQTYTLNDLRNDDEFNERTYRFLQSIGEGKTADDLFGYFRGMEFNLGDATQAMFQTKKFNEQQKEDFVYLQNKFNNAEVGDWLEWARTAGDIGQEIISDPTMIASALFVPWTGGTSLATRIAAGKAVQTGIKKITNKSIAESVKKGFAALPGQKLKKPLTNVQRDVLVGIEGMAYGSTYDFLRQSRELNIGQREDYSLKETALSGVFGGVLGYGASFGLRQLANTPSYLRSMEERRLAKIDHNENYKDTVVDKAQQAALYGLTLFTKPTSSFLVRAKKSEKLSYLVKLFRYDTEKSIIAGPTGTTQRMTDSYGETVNAFIGTRLEKLQDILTKYDLYELGRREVTAPFSAGAVINPLRSQTKRTRKTVLKSYRLTEKTNNALAEYLRSGNKKGVDSNIVAAGDEIRGLLDDILDEAVKSGLNINKVKNFFPRVWLLDAMKRNKNKFILQLARDENISTDKARKIFNDMVDLNKVDGTSASHLSSLKAERKLLKIDDSKYGEFLDNNIENVLQDYIFQAGKLIGRKKTLGETLEEFTERFIKPIDEELGGAGLTDFERQKLKNLYLFTTGQRGYINNPVARFASDAVAVGIQTSLLPFATITSFAEIGVPLLRGADTTTWGKAVWNGVVDSTDEWWKGVKTSLGKEGTTPDSRSLNRRELNAFNRSLDMAREDRATAIYGQALGRNFTKIQNVFFKGILLHDWTRFVQLVAYDTGKGIIYRNLDDLTNKKLSKVKKDRLTDELNELGIDINKGLEWIKSGAKHTDDFYMDEVRKAAARYTDEVIMNPVQASAQKPLLHIHPATKWSFGLLGFPTAFSNTVLKNAIREITKDVRTFGKTSKAYTPQALSGLLVMTMAGLAGNTLRTGGRNLEEYGRGEKPLYSGPLAVAQGKKSGLIDDALIRSGLYGPFEYYVRTKEAERYENNITAALSSLTGPAVSDIIDYIRASQYRGATAETVYKKAPFITVLRSAFPEAYQEGLKYARELDEAGGPKRPEKERFPLVKGGLVEGPDVPFTDEDPADRINPITGQPYSGKTPQEEQLGRLGFAQGGEVNMLDGFLIEEFYKQPAQIENIRVAPAEEQMERLGFQEGGEVDLVELIKANLREKEDLRLEAYKPIPNEKYYTIGYGRYGSNIKKGDKITLEEAEQYLDEDVNVRLKEISRLIPDYNSYPLEVQVPLFSEFYRGSVRQSPKTIELLNQKKYKEAAMQFLDNEEYRKAKELGKPGIRPRMEELSNALLLLG